MNLLSVAALLGLTGLISGIVLVNTVPGPRVGQLGTITAASGVFLLAAVAVSQLFR